MRYFVPDLVISTENSAGMPIEHLGGVPIGLDAAAWPKCSECGGAQSLLAQFLHHHERLDLGRDGRNLLIFQCNHDPGMCATWESFSGANACLVIEPEDLSETETSCPLDQTPLENCVRISDWIQRDDGLTEEQCLKFQSDEDFFGLEEEIIQEVTWSTRLGGVPRWLQSPSEAPSPDWYFLGQLDSSYSFLRAPRHPPAWVSADPENFEGRTHLAQGPNFGGGIAYLFTQKESDVPRVVMFWQR